MEMENKTAKVPMVAHWFDISDENEVLYSEARDAFGHTGFVLYVGGGQTTLSIMMVL